MLHVVENCRFVCALNGFSYFYKTIKFVQPKPKPAEAAESKPAEAAKPAETKPEEAKPEEKKEEKAEAPAEKKDEKPEEKMDTTPAASEAGGVPVAGSESTTSTGTTASTEQCKYLLNTSLALHF